jgi:hypothetical protein
MVDFLDQFHLYYMLCSNPSEKILLVDPPVPVGRAQRTSGAASSLVELAVLLSGLAQDEGAGVVGAAPGGGAGRGGGDVRGGEE